MGVIVTYSKSEIAHTDGAPSVWENVNFVSTRALFKDRGDIRSHYEGPVWRYSTVFAVRAADRREGASLGVTLRLHQRVAQIKVYKQHRTPKVAPRPQFCSF